jgi:ribosomal protein S25
MSDEYLTIFAIMPKEIYKTKELSPEDKLIAERLVYLCKKEGYSWITNKALADIYGIKEDSASQHITNLRKYGFIKCVYENETHSKSSRTIYLTEDLWSKQPVPNRFNNQNDIGYTTGHNNNYNYKNNKKDNAPEWLTNEDLCKSQEWDFNNPEDVKQYQELKDMLAEFGDDSDE